MEKEQLTQAIVKLKMYRKKREDLAIKKAQLSLLDEAGLKTSKLTDDAGGSHQDIFDRLEKLMKKKECLKVEVVELEMELRVIDKAFELMNSEGGTMQEASNVIKMRHIENKSLVKIQMELKMSESTVKRRLKKGEQEFARLLQIA